MKNIEAKEQSPKTIKKQVISQIPTSQLMELNVVLAKLVSIKNGVTEYEKQLKKTISTIKKWNQTNDKCLIKEAQSTLSKVKDHLIMSLEILIEDFHQKEENIVEQFTQNLSNFFRTFQSQKQESSIKSVEKNFASSTISIHVLQHTWEQLEQIKQTYKKQFLQKQLENEELRMKIEQAEQQLINMHNKYQQLQEDLEESKNSPQSSKDKDLLENLLNLEDSLNEFKQIVKELTKQKQELEKTVKEINSELLKTKQQNNFLSSENVRMQKNGESLRIIVEEKMFQIKKLTHEKDKAEHYESMFGYLGHSRGKQNDIFVEECKCQANFIVKQIISLLEKNYRILSPRKEKKSEVFFTYLPTK